MAITLTVRQAVNGLADSYRQDIKRAAGDNVLSPAEQARLSPFARRHIAARAAGNSLSVNQAVSALKPVLTKAAKAIAGEDGLIDASEVQQLRVAELKTRAASLFEESPPVGQAALNKALEGVNIPRITEYGRSFDLREYPERETIKSMVEKMTQHMGPVVPWATVTPGPEAVDGFVKVVRDAGQAMLDNAEEPDEGKDLQARMDQVATAVTGTFRPGEFKQIVGVRHTIAEDGDVEQNLLFGQKAAGAWVVLSYTDAPF